MIFFSQKRNSENKILKVNIDFKYKNGRFLDSQMVNKLLIQRKDTSFFLNKDMLDLRKVEDLLISNPMVARADIFRTPQGFLNVKLEERKPIARIINNNEEFYIETYRIHKTKSIFVKGILDANIRERTTWNDAFEGDCPIVI